MNKWHSLLKRLVERIKKVLTDLFVQFGAMGIPLGFAIMFASYEFFEDWRMQFGIVLGILVVLAGYYAFSYAIKLRKSEEAKRQDNLNVLIEEIRGLRKDITSKVGKNDASL